MAAFRGGRTVSLAARFLPRAIRHHSQDQPGRPNTGTAALLALVRKRRHTIHDTGQLRVPVIRQPLRNNVSAFRRDGVYYDSALFAARLPDGVWHCPISSGDTKYLAPINHPALLDILSFTCLRLDGIDEHPRRNQYIAALAGVDRTTTKNYVHGFRDGGWTGLFLFAVHDIAAVRDT